VLVKNVLPSLMPGTRSAPMRLRVGSGLWVVTAKLLFTARLRGRATRSNGPLEHLEALHTESLKYVAWLKAQPETIVTKLNLALVGLANSEASHIGTQPSPNPPTGSCSSRSTRSMTLAPLSTISSVNSRS
jgi:hypothetical protein